MKPIPSRSDGTREERRKEFFTGNSKNEAFACTLNHKVLPRFVEYIASANREEIKDVLIFITGSCKIPCREKLTIEFRGRNSPPEGRLPTAVTCHSILMICDDYGAEEELQAKADFRTAFPLRTYGRP